MASPQVEDLLFLRIWGTPPTEAVPACRRTYSNVDTKLQDPDPDAYRLSVMSASIHLLSYPLSISVFETVAIAANSDCDHCGTGLGLGKNPQGV